MIETPSWQPMLNSDCDTEMDHLDLSAGGHAWLLVRKRLFANGDTTGFASAWSSPDGGRTWARKFDTEFKNPSSMFTDFDGPYPLGDHLTLILKRGPDDKASALYTQAGGGAWTETPLAAPISNCFAARRALVCSGAGFSLATITAGGGR